MGYPDVMTDKFYRVAELPISPKLAEGLIKASQRGSVLIARDGRPYGVVLADAEYRRLLANQPQMRPQSGAFPDE